MAKSVDINKILKSFTYLIMILSVLFPVGAFLLLPIAISLAIMAGKSRAMARTFLKDKAVLMLMGSCLISILFSRLVPVSLAIVVPMLLQLAYMCMLDNTLDASDVEIWYRLISITAITACIAALGQLFWGSYANHGSWVDHNSFGIIRRAYGTLYNPNIFAGFLVLNLCYSLARYVVKGMDRLTFINIAFSSLCLVLTYSRGGLLALCAGAAVLYAFRRNKKLLIYLGAVVLSFYLANRTGAVNRTDLTSVITDSSNTYRIEIWKAGLKMFLEHPITGSGVGTAWVFLSTYSDKLFRYVLHAHNIFIQMAAETGILGLLSLLYFLVGSAREAVQSILRMNEEASFVLLGFAAGLAGIVVHGMIDAVIFLPSLSMIFISYYSIYKLVCKTIAVKDKKAALEEAGYYEEHIA